MTQRNGQVQALPAPTTQSPDTVLAPEGSFVLAGEYVQSLIEPNLTPFEERILAELARSKAWIAHYRSQLKKAQARIQELEDQLTAV